MNKFGGINQSQSLIFFSSEMEEGNTRGSSVGVERPLDWEDVGVCDASKPCSGLEDVIEKCLDYLSPECVMLPEALRDELRKRLYEDSTIKESDARLLLFLSNLNGFICNSKVTLDGENKISLRDLVFLMIVIKTDSTMSCMCAENENKMEYLKYLGQCFNSIAEADYEKADSNLRRSLEKARSVRETRNIQQGEKESLKDFFVSVIKELRKQSSQNK